jgi:DNA polymerase III alpha subunit
MSMKVDQYSRQILDENDLCHIFLSNPSIKLNRVLVEKPINIPESLELSTNIQTKLYQPLDISINEFDKISQENWYMPNEYKEFDIAKFVLDLCNTEEELQRVGEELLLFQERNMFMLLRYCKYLVDLMRKNNIVWGIGRGSSVASYVLFLIGIHKINSIYYDLPIDEFLK